MPRQPRLGGRVRGLRLKHALTQRALAERLGVSPSYLNLIEHNRRPLPAPMLLDLVETFGVDLAEFSTDDTARTADALLEVAADPMLKDLALGEAELRDLASNAPDIAQAVVRLYARVRDATGTAESLAEMLHDGDEASPTTISAMPSDEVSDLIQESGNYFHPLEQAAEALRSELEVDADDLASALTARLLDVHGVEVHIAHAGDMPSALRRYDPKAKRLMLSEALERPTRSFQLAHQLCLFEHRAVLDSLIEGRRLTTSDAQRLAVVALANYFAGAVMMPYESFLAAAENERYDIERLCHRFRARYEQVCHRLTSLRRPGSEGVPLHLVRVDIAGNISKQFSATGMKFARFSATCGRWAVHSAFLTPGEIRCQIEEMPDGERYFCVARTLRRERVGYQHAGPRLAISVGCRLADASRLVYSDHVQTGADSRVTMIGTACRVCNRSDCDQRASPAIHQPLRIDENVRGLSFFAPPADR